MNLAFLGAVSGAVHRLRPRRSVGLFGGTTGASRRCRHRPLRIVSIGFVFYAYGMVPHRRVQRRGAAVWTPTIINFFCFWLWEIPLAWVLSVSGGLGATGVFIAMTVSFSTLAVVSAILFRRGKWKQATV